MSFYIETNNSTFSNEIKKKLTRQFTKNGVAINKNAKMIMVGHISFPKITGDNTPASLSKKIITDILLNDLNYKGLVITDALDMGALTNYYSDEEIISMTLDAGVDLLLMPEDIYGAKEYIKENISEERINASVSKILTHKYKYLKDYDLLDKSYLNNSEEQNIINKIYKWYNVYGGINEEKEK